MKFIHTADIHLGAHPDRIRSFGRNRGQELWQSFHRLIEQVNEEEADLLLIAGDLFHYQPGIRELKEVNYLFEKLENTQVVLIMGNHDYVQRDGAISHFQWADNVTCLLGREPESVYYEGLDTTIYGLSYHSFEVKTPLYDDLHPDEEKGCHILLAHGGDEKHSPLNKAKLAASGFDYIALGHIHKPEILAADRMAYSGALEPIDCNETGPHGYIRGEYTDGEMRIEFVPFAAREYIHLKIESDSSMTELSMRDTIRKTIEYHGLEHMYRISLTGYRDPDLIYHTEGFELLGNIVDIQDLTEPQYDLKALLEEHRQDICGRFIAKLYDEKQQKKDELSEIQKKALAYGIRAMLGEK